MSPRPMPVGPGPRGRRSNAFALLYRCRYEVGGLLVVLGIIQLGRAVSPAVPLVLAATLTIALVWFRPLRKWCRSRIWVIVVQHRLHSVFRGSALMNVNGRVPVIIWTSPRPAGVRVLVHLSAGLEVADVRAEAQAIAAGCFASDVVVERHERYANVVALYLVMVVAAPGPAREN